jgi:AraC-like DNA-binding protein
MSDSAGSDHIAHLAAHIGTNYADSFAACRELVAGMFDLDTPRLEQRAHYVKDFALYDFGPVKLAMCTASPSVMVRSAETIARTGTDHFHVQFYRSGNFAVTLDGAQRTVSAGNICLLDLSRPVTIRTDRVDNLSVMIARDQLLPLLANLSDVHGLVLPHGTASNAVVRDHLEEMWSLGSVLTVDEGLEWSHATVKLLAAVINSEGVHSAATRGALRQSQFRTICRRIEKHLGDPNLGASAFAELFHVSRPTLYRMFEPHGGIDRYILSRRLAQSFRNLSDRNFHDEKIADVFNRWGLPNHTTAGRSFRQAYGITPSEVRNQAVTRLGNEQIPGKNAFDIPSRMPARIKAFEV